MDTKLTHSFGRGLPGICAILFVYGFEDMIQIRGTETIYSRCLEIERTEREWVYILITTSKMVDSENLLDMN